MDDCAGKFMSDKYDEAVEYLTAHPSEIVMAWNDPHVHEGGCLFSYVTPTGTNNHEDRDCGCLTQVAKSFAEAWTPELTAAIHADDRIPQTPDAITVEHLPIFAQWQRRIDKELNRT